jgi:hypothetical protein
MSSEDMNWLGTGAKGRDAERENCWLAEELSAVESTLSIDTHNETYIFHSPWWLAFDSGSTGPINVSVNHSEPLSLELNLSIVTLLQ